jgi:hypothetical protein
MSAILPDRGLTGGFMITLLHPGKLFQVKTCFLRSLIPTFNNSAFYPKSKSFSLFSNSLLRFSLTNNISGHSGHYTPLFHDAFS